MRAEQAVAVYRRLREEPLWRLLAADNGPVILALLQVHLYDDQRTLPASVLYERIARDLERLRALGEDLPQTAQAYVARWLADGYLVRRFPPGAAEEEYELSTAAAEAIRFLSGQVRPHAAATESRLALVMAALVRLAEETDTDKFRRLDRLLAEQARLEREIAAVHQGQLRVLPEAAALERAREVIALADGLVGDFRRVRDSFERLNRELRERIMENDGHRGEVLEALFAGIDLIGESEAGRSFAAFWRLLTDPEQSAALEDALDQVLARGFAGRLEPGERRFLRRLMWALLEQGGQVHDVMQTFARSLKHFVQSREYLEHRRLVHLLREAQREALALKDSLRATEKLDYALMLTSSRVRSLAQWVLHDPTLEAEAGPMLEGEPAPVDLEAVADLVAHAEIDFRTLRTNVRAVLAESSQASIADVLARFPATQGLGSVVGLLALAYRHGVRGEGTETVAWTGGDGCRRRARVPRYFFVRERLAELA